MKMKKLKKLTLKKEVIAKLSPHKLKSIFGGNPPNESYFCGGEEVPTK